MVSNSVPLPLGSITGGLSLLITFQRPDTYQCKFYSAVSLYVTQEIFLVSHMSILISMQAEGQMLFRKGRNGGANFRLSLLPPGIDLVLVPYYLRFPLHPSLVGTCPDAAGWHYWLPISDVKKPTAGSRPIKNSAELLPPFHIYNAHWKQAYISEAHPTCHWFINLSKRL